ncbi:MAG: hypothetical protein M1828_001629 [Chrysothrix sp. TS-e1954]|nr:MAG: hypothetical protein M1828_001629 [Chrysothrix sp. TS-e1954]
MPEIWQPIAARKQRERDACIPPAWRLKSLPTQSTNVTSIPRTCGILTKEELDITEQYDATSLARAIAERQLQCVDVTRAYCKRAAIAQQLTNCLTEPLFEQAMQRAEWLDHQLKRTGQPIGPLHGVPVSVKDGFQIAGTDASIGIASLALKPSTSTSPLVSLLLSAGAVIHCKTNIPQTLMALDSVNNVFGRTLNPLNNKWTAGGSSGGAGVVAAMRASPIAVGTDIGGSIRVPAMCNGVYGVKPSSYRVPYEGQQSGHLPGAAQLGIEASAGPICASFRDCELFLKTVAEAKPWNSSPGIIPGLWGSMDARGMSSAPRPLKIGVLYSDNLATPHPPIHNLLNSTADALRKTAHTVLPLTPPSSISAAQSLANGLMGLEGAGTMADHLAATSEPVIPWLKPTFKARAPRTLHQAAALHVRREQMMKDMLSLWRAPDGSEIDALICPVAPHCVPPIDSWKSVGYTSMWVLLDCPAGTVPIREFVEEDLKGEMKDVPGGAESLGRFDDANRTLWEGADRSVYLGSPLCVQVVAPRLQEKRLCDAMRAVAEAVGRDDVGDVMSARESSVNEMVGAKL